MEPLAPDEADRRLDTLDAKLGQWLSVFESERHTFPINSSILC